MSSWLCFSSHCVAASVPSAAANVMAMCSARPVLGRGVCGAFTLKLTLGLCALVQEILAESFDPIVELATGADLMPAMVYAQELGAWDYTGMFTAVLRHRVRTACCAFVLPGRFCDCPDDQSPCPGQTGCRSSIWRPESSFVCARPLAGHGSIRLALTLHNDHPSRGLASTKGSCGQ